MSQSEKSNNNQMWAERIKAQMSSGLSMQKWCNDNKIKVHVFQYWRDKLNGPVEKIRVLLERN